MTVSFSDMPLKASLCVSIRRLSTLEFAKANGSINRYTPPDIAQFKMNFLGTVIIYFK